MAYRGKGKYKGKRGFKSKKPKCVVIIKKYYGGRKSYRGRR